VRRRELSEQIARNDAVLARNGQAFERVVAGMDRIKKQLDAHGRQLEASSGSLSEILEEVRAQSQTIFILIDRLSPP
jgi:ABC-type transporter Mla subunit MlaD